MKPARIGCIAALIGFGGAVTWVIICYYADFRFGMLCKLHNDCDTVFDPKSHYVTDNLAMWHRFGFFLTTSQWRYEVYPGISEVLVFFSLVIVPIWVWLARRSSGSN